MSRLEDSQTDLITSELDPDERQQAIIEERLEQERAENRRHEQVKRMCCLVAVPCALLGGFLMAFMMPFLQYGSEKVQNWAHHHHDHNTTHNHSMRSLADIM